MKRKFIGGFAVLAIAAMAAQNVNYGSQTKGMSDIMLANVEALAGDEEPEKNNGYRSTNTICIVDHVIYYKCTYDGRDLYHCTCPC